MVKKKPRTARGITSYRAAQDAEWVEVDGQRVPDRFYVETTIDYEWVDMEESDEEGEPVYVPEGRHRPYERITYVMEEGRMVLDEYELRRWPGLDLSDTVLRDRGTDALGRRALESLAKGPGGPGFRRDLGLTTPDEHKARQRALDSIPSATTGRPPVDEDEVEEAARVYLEARSEGKAPAKAVEALGLSRAQARLRIKRARERGLLPAYERGRHDTPGEVASRAAAKVRGDRR